MEKADKMMENKNMMGKMLGDDEMEKAAGGARKQQNPQFDIGEKVLVFGRYIGRDYNLYYGEVTNRFYNEQPGENTWYYTVNVDGRSSNLKENQLSSTKATYFP